jgi:hypothetical protein
MDVQYDSAGGSVLCSAAEYRKEGDFLCETGCSCTTMTSPKMAVAAESNVLRSTSKSPCCTVKPQQGLFIGIGISVPSMEGSAFSYVYSGLLGRIYQFIDVL